MKTINLIRHAKSSWDSPDLTDIERPLSKKWKRQIQFLWNFLKKIDLRVDFTICSEAKRAKDTFLGIKKIHPFFSNKYIRLI